MTVLELRELLAGFDDDLLVLVDDPVHGACVTPLFRAARDAHSGQVIALEVALPSVVEAAEGFRSRSLASVHSLAAWAKKRRA